MADESLRPAVVLREVVPTLEDAKGLFDRVLARLGERAVVLTANGGKSRVVFVRARSAGPFLVPTPLLTLAIAEPPADGIPDDEDRVIQLPPAEPGEMIPIPMDLRPMPASLTVHDGALNLTVNYRWSGRWKDSCEPAERDAFADLLPALSRSGTGRLDVAADWVASIDLGRHGPARVLQPRPTPGGPEGTWSIARAAIREAMVARRAPPGSFWAVADGYVGTAIAFGARREEAVAAWREEVKRVRPAPPPPPPDPTLPSPSEEMEPPGEWDPDEPPEAEGIRIMCSGWDAPPFDPAPEFVPAGAVLVGAVPAEKSAQGTWTRWLGDRGTTTVALRVPMSDGHVLVGEALLPRVKLAGLEARLDALQRRIQEFVQGPSLPRPRGVAPYTHAIFRFACVDAATGTPIEPRLATSQWGHGFDARHFDGGCLRTHIVRVQHLPPGQRRSPA
jgi:hypothetical protein